MVKTNEVAGGGCLRAYCLYIDQKSSVNDLVEGKQM